MLESTQKLRKGMVAEKIAHSPVNPPDVTPKGRLFKPSNQKANKNVANRQQRHLGHKERTNRRMIDIKPFLISNEQILR